MTMEESTATPAATPAAKPKFLVLPETFSCNGCFLDWIEHFESIAAVNSWDDAAKALWLLISLPDPNLSRGKGLGTLEHSLGLTHHHVTTRVPIETLYK